TRLEVCISTIDYGELQPSLGTKNVLSRTFSSAAATPVLAAQPHPDQNNDQNDECEVKCDFLFPIHPCVPRRATGLQPRLRKDYPSGNGNLPNRHDGLVSSWPR